MSFVAEQILVSEFLKKYPQKAIEFFDDLEPNSQIELFNSLDDTDKSTLFKELIRMGFPRLLQN